MSTESVRVSAKVLGSFDNTYTCELEIDRYESEVIDSNCDCSHSYDCQHLTALIFFLELRLNELIVSYSKEADLQENEIDEDERELLIETIKKAETKEEKRQGAQFQKELEEEYIHASRLLSESPFFLPKIGDVEDSAQIMLIFHELEKVQGKFKGVEVQASLRLPYRSKPLHIANLKQFLDAVRYREPIELSARTHLFATRSFGTEGGQLLRMLLDAIQFNVKEDRPQKMGFVPAETFGMLLARAFEMATSTNKNALGLTKDFENLALPCLYLGSLEEPIRVSSHLTTVCFRLEYLKSPAEKLFLLPQVSVNDEMTIKLDDAVLLECAKPGIVYDNTYYRFHSNLRRSHLRNLEILRDMAIPKPLFGTFAENAMETLSRYAKVENLGVIDSFVTLPFVEDVRAVCQINYLDGELEADLAFCYGKAKIPSIPEKVEIEHIQQFVTEEGILARNLTEERELIKSLFQGFMVNDDQGTYVAKTDKKVIEFMTEVVPAMQGRVDFKCPQNLLDRFIYDDTSFTLKVKESEQIDQYEIDLKVKGPLKGVSLDLLWDCISSGKSYIELSPRNGRSASRRDASSSNQKILVLDLNTLSAVVRIFDEIGLKVLDNVVEIRPLWSLANLSHEMCKELPIKFSMSRALKEVQKQMLGEKALEASPIPESIQASLRSYQCEGVNWLERLRRMHLSGILADDMGLGKTLQAIIAVTQKVQADSESTSIVVCPTSLIYNWEEEFHKFNPNIRVLPIDGTPSQRKKLLATIADYHVVVTSYSLLQKDIEIYKQTNFSYAILDEAQQIKNRGTRNAKSVKMILAQHRLILTGTPIENSLEELWSLFDFLMPGLLSSYDRFVEKYIRGTTNLPGSGMEQLRRKVAPFILRRMKQDVLDDLPPVSEIVYHCHLSETQKELYRSYADSAREELSRLVQKEGFDRVQIHVLATLTRLKQICCHPAIFAKERPEEGDSAKYDMLLELVPSLIEGGHKTVLFSQYTQMLKIMRNDFEKMGIRFSYLDGSSKNRQQIVRNFNEDEEVSIFLVSLKAGGSGLNLASADTVIHFDMWWNPAVENQATDRVHRIGQKRSVSAYKLVTLGTIEEKILELQNRKKELVKQVVGCDDEAISKLTWEEVLELLQT